MSKIDNIKIKNFIHSLGLEYRLPDEVIKKITESPYEFTYNQVKEWDLVGLESVDELEKLKSTFLYKVFGKIHISKALIKTKMERKKKK